MALWVLVLFLVQNLAAWADPFDDWSLRNPIPTTRWAQDVAFGNGRLLAVGQDLVGLVLTSLDGVNWSENKINGNFSFSSIQFGGGRFSTIGYDSDADPFSRTNIVLWHSTNGFDWFPAQAPDLDVAEFLAYGGGRFVLVGIKRMATGGIPLLESTWVSQDGVSWTLATDRVLADSDGALFSSMGYANRRFVGLTKQFAWVSSDGSSWEPYPLDVTNTWLTLFVAGDRFFALDLRARAVNPGSPISPSYVYTSPDGIVWTPHEYPYPAVVRPPQGYIHGVFVHLSERQLYTSEDGLDWVERPLDLPLPVSLTKLVGAFGGLAGVGVGWGGGNQPLLLSSQDGLKWTDHVGGVRGGLLTAAAYGAGRWVTVGSPQTTRTSTNNLGLATVAPDRWQSVLLPRVQAYYTRVAYGSPGFVAVGRASTEGGAQPPGALAFSRDGLTWVDRTPAGAPVLSSVAYGNGLFVVPAANQVFTSEDGEHWTGKLLPELTDFVAGRIVAGAGRFVCLGSSISTVYVSTNGTDWTAANPGFSSSGSMRGLAYGGGRFVILRDGSVAVSTNGLDWTSQSLLSPGSVRDIIWANGSFVALRVASGPSNPAWFSTMWTSTDGLAWTQRSFTCQGQLQALAPGPSSVLAIGERAAILESAPCLPIGRLPWLEVRNGMPVQILLHGISGRSYRVDRRATLSVTEDWVPGETLSVTNDTTAWSLDPPSGPSGFYRALEFP